MKKSFFKTLLLLCLVLITSFSVSCRKKCKNHDYVDGVCSKCEAVDPNYHTHSYVNGKCSCGELDPNYKPEPLRYTITFNLNGGSLSNAPKEYDGSIDVLLPSPTKEGYDFDGWYETSDFSDSIVSKIEKGATGNKVFYAKWSEIPAPETYCITFITNGGILLEYVISYDETQEVVLPTPTKVGYTFDGWYETSDFTDGVVNKIERGTTGNKTLFAKWETISYLIIYNTNNGNLSNAPVNYDITQNVILPTPTRDGYEFIGWYSDSQFSGDMITSITEGSIGNKEFFAKWETITYSISYNTNNGSLSNATVNYDVTQNVILPTPTRNGYSFVGWYSDSQFGGDKITSITEGSIGNKEFFAKWEIISYLITYNTNNGNLSNAPVNYNISQTVILPTPTRDGYEFIGWYSDSQFSGDMITSITEGSIGDKEFFARWRKITYLISYNTNEGSLSNAPVDYDVTQNVILPTPTKNGYNFVGWYSDSQFNGDKITSITEGTIGNKEFFAKWEKAIYTITFILNGGSLSSFPKEYDVDDNVSLPTPIREGYKFAGWYENAQFVGLTMVNIVKGSSGNKVFYAKWVEESTTSDGRPWELNRCGFDGQSMKYVIKVQSVIDNDPYEVGYTGTKQALKQAHQAEVEDAYNIRIEYSAWDNEAQWNPARVQFIKTSFYDGSFQKKNVYAIEIMSQYIPTLVKADCLAELYNYDTGEGIFADYKYDQNSVINQSVAVRRKIYGYQPGVARPDAFVYYNVNKIASIGMDDPAEMWFRGEWTWSNFDKWVKDAQVKLGSGEYAIDCGYAEFIIGAAPAQGKQLVNAFNGGILFTKLSVNSLFEKMKDYYREGYWDTRHGIQNVSTNFKAGKTLIHSGSLWFLKESTRFTPEGEDGGINFKIGVVPYPLDDNTIVTPYTEPYSYEDNEGNLVEVTTPLKTRTNETLTTKTGEPIYGIDLSESNYNIPYTGSSCFSLINNAGTGENGMNPSVAFCILNDLMSDMVQDPDDEVLTSDDAYRLYLNNKLDYSIDVEAVMSVQDTSLSYYELMEVLSITVGEGSHFGPNGFWLVANGMISSDHIPLAKFKEIETPYKKALEGLGY